MQPRRELANGITTGEVIRAEMVAAYEYQFFKTLSCKTFRNLRKIYNHNSRNNMSMILFIFLLAAQQLYLSITQIK